MGFFSRLFGKENKPAKAPAEQVKPQPTDTPAADTAPDKPLSFGYKTCWLCVKSVDSMDVINRLGLKDPRESSWRSGLASSEGVFVTPPLDGWVCVIGYGMADGSLFEDSEKLERVLSLFDEAQYFSSHRVVDYYAWARAENGVMTRCYAWCPDSGGAFLSFGEFTPEEEALGFDEFPQTEDEDWESSPDEESVVKLAAAWGLDPFLGDRDYPLSTGYICTE